MRGSRRLLVCISLLLIAYFSIAILSRPESECSIVKGQPFHQTRKVYDFFLINTEVDWLEVRLRELQDVVDYFVIAESTQTFTGLNKSLGIAKHLAQYDDLRGRIYLHIIDDHPQTDSNWVREDYQRNALFEQAIPNLPQPPEIDDILLVSDIDEIPRPETISLLRHCSFPNRVTLNSRFFYYSYDWLHRGPEWPHPQATTYQGTKTILPQLLRIGEGTNWFMTKLAWFDKVTLRNASWHCSSCFSTLSEVRTKLSSFSHSGWNQDEFREQKHLINVYRNGLDLFDREGEVYDHVNSSDCPRYILANRGIFDYMLDRQHSHARFKDVNVTELMDARQT